MAHLIPNIIQKFFDANGEPLVGGKLYSFQAGTSTPLATYQDAAETTPNTNPIILDANGECRIFIGAQAYKFRLDDADDVTLWTEDGISHISNGSITTDKIANGAVTAPKLADSSVLESKIGTGAVTETKIGTGAVTESKLGALSVSTAKIQDGAVTNAKIADGTIETAKLSNSALSVLIQAKNKIMNGDFDIWQLGTSFTNANNLVIGPDRWFFRKFGTTSINIVKSSDVPTFAQAGRVITSSVEFTTTSALAATGSNGVFFTQGIEGGIFKSFAQKPITLSFWVKAPSAGTRSVCIQNGAEDLSYIAEYTVVAANTWEKKTITFPGTPSSGTWYYTNQPGLFVTFALAAGPSRQNTAGSWHSSGAAMATSAQPNDCGTNGNKFSLAGVQLEPGSVATEFEARDVSIELNLVKRYRERLFFSMRGYNPNLAVTGPVSCLAYFKAEKLTTGYTHIFTNGPNYSGSNIAGAAVALQSIYGVEIAANFVASGTSMVHCNGEIMVQCDYV